MPKFMYRNKMKAMTLFLLLIVFLSHSAGNVFAQNMSGDSITLEAGQTLEKTSFFSGNQVRIDGDINGTAFAAASQVEVNGTIDGDLFVAAQRITINGAVTGSIFTASQNVMINGNVDNNIYSAGAILNVNSQTNGSVFLAGQKIYVENEALIARDAFIGGAQIHQNGIIHGDLTSSSDSLAVNGKIGGDLKYSSKAQADVSDDSEIVGTTTWKQVQPTVSKPTSSAFSWVFFLLNLLAAFVVWFVARLIHRNLWIHFAEKIRTFPKQTLGFGALALISIPIAAVLLMFTVIGIPLSLILLALYATSIYMSKIIVSVWIGLWFQKKYNGSNAQAFWLFLLALISFSLLVTVPFIGWIIRFVIVSFGLGSIILSIKNKKVVYNTDDQM